MFKSTSTFDKLLDKATSLSNLEPDWNTILQICDNIRQGDVQPKYALSAIKKKLYATNPNVELLALQVLESCVKNCGAPFHAEVTTKSFMEELRELVKVTTDAKVRDEILKLIQMWGHAFRNDQNYRAVQDTVNLMKIEGHKFPPLKESDAMFAADSAPEWADGECCHRCRVQFTMVQRKHHCRNCGQIFCAKCSAKQSTIPRYGIEREVRVCEDCHDKLNKTDVKQKAEQKSGSSESSPDLSKPKTNSGGKTDAEIQEEEELQLALALSQSEAESKERDRMRGSALTFASKSTFASDSLPKKNESVLKNYTTNDDPELSHYLNRDYWEQKLLNYQNDDSVNPTAPPCAPQPQISTGVSAAKNTITVSNEKLEEKLQNGSTDEMEDFLGTLRSTIEIFVNRINSNQLRGRPIHNDSAVQSLFLNITNMHSQLLTHVQQQDDARSHFEGLQDKLNQIRDARAALEEFREEHQEKLRREAEEAEIMRQQQMAQKLEIMRKKKQEYLQYQREIAMHRMQEQEREMNMRKEQQKYMWQQPQPSHGISQPMIYPPQQVNAGHFQPQPQPPQYSNVNNQIPQHHIPPQMPVQTSPAHQSFGPPTAVASQMVNFPPQPHGYVTTQSGIGPYNIQQIANALPQGIPPGIAQQYPPQQIQSNTPQHYPNVPYSNPNLQPETVEAPLISFD